MELINDKVPQSMTNSVPKPGTYSPLKLLTGNVLEGRYLMAVNVSLISLRFQERVRSVMSDLTLGIY